MTLASAGIDTAKPTLRPRIIDVSDALYETVNEYVSPGEDAYFERKGGSTLLVVR